MRAVTATALGSWPGSDPVEACRVIRGELGAPHLPHLPELPARGVGADPVGRTAAILAEMPVDVQPHGWRLVDRPGQDHRRAVSWLNTDINALADVIGQEQDPGSQLKLQLRGPLSLAANLYLHHGERAVSDAGARREILQSLCAGLTEHLARVARICRGADLILQLDEPGIDRMIAGTIPTASGYRTLRSISEQEILAAWRTAAEAARGAGATEVTVSAPSAGLAVEKLDEAGLDAAALRLNAMSDRQWEGTAAAIEAGRGLWAGLDVPQEPGSALPQVTSLVDEVMGPWRRIGLPLHQLGQLRLTPSAGLSGSSPEQARRVLTRLTETADALNQLAAG